MSRFFAKPGDSSTEESESESESSSSESESSEDEKPQQKQKVLKEEPKIRKGVASPELPVVNPFALSECMRDEEYVSVLS
jgi:hypothetical protein